MGHPRRLFAYAAVLTLASLAAGPNRAPSAGLSATSGCAPDANTSRCVFLAPFDGATAAEMAVFRVDIQYGLLDYVATHSVCRPAKPDRDRLGRKGWKRVNCDITLIGETGSACAVEHDGKYTDSGPCTGTIWQLDDRPGHLIRDTHAKRARFEVVLLKHPQTCSVVARIRQLPPFTPRIPRP
jgi:hypothetical protein